MAVDEDQEEVVASSIKITKELYQRIYASSNKTQDYVKMILSENNKEKGYLYKFGRLLIDAGVPQEILSRVIDQDNQNQILNSFCLLYSLDKVNGLNHIKNNTERIIEYVGKQY